ncbi:MAG TPA: alpha/beta hydrolase [Ktedonobacteraceae bacterium]|nr:alpha/beta hydrolase [Ktedonobacteraceae bacterium]
MNFWQIAGFSAADLLVLLLVFLVVTSIYQLISIARDERKYPPAGKLVDVGGYRLHVTIQGEGGPTVVMDAGLAHISTVWSLVQPEVTTFARVCTIDRAGHAWSDAGPLPRTSRQICEELHALLANASIEGPYVLVGHSFGGLNMYLYASLYPDEVTGLVLLDALSRDIDLYTPREFSLFILANRLKYRVYSPLTRLGITRLYLRLKGVDAAQDFIVHLPLELRYSTIAGYLRKTFIAAARECASLRASVQQARLAQPLRDIPLVVIAHGLPEMFAGHMSAEEAAQAEQHWQQMQAELARLSPSGTYMIAEKSGHKIHIDQPELVVDAIRQVVEATRTKYLER